MKRCQLCFAAVIITLILTISWKFMNRPEDADTDTTEIGVSKTDNATTAGHLFVKK